MTTAGFKFASAAASGPTIWIDADTGNEMDDLYAIFRLLIEPVVAVVGLSSAHFNNADLVAFERWNQYPTVGIDTVRLSQELNEQILAAMDRGAIPHPLGADRAMGRAWGGTEPRDSPAARGIIAATSNLAENERLAVLNLGALTNVASAVALDPGIADRLTVYLLGARYDSETRVWNKNDFNIRNDLNAFDFLLDHPTLDLVIMPTNTATEYRFDKTVMLAALSDAVPPERLLRWRWEETNPQDQTRVLWDVALVQAFLRPELARLEDAWTPAENTARAVRVYTRIDVAGMISDLFAKFENSRAD